MQDANNITALTLRPADLLSKWGFGDGDMMCDPLEEWLPLSDWYHIVDPENYDSPVDVYLSPTSLLIKLVHDHLLPILPKNTGLNLTRVFTVHNPIRLEDNDNSADLEDDDVRARSLEEDLEAIQDVVVTGAQIDAACRELFPLRGSGWLKMYKLLWMVVRLAPSTVKETRTAVTSTTPELPATLLELDERYKVTALIDSMAQSFDNVELGLAAELASTRAGQNTLNDDIFNYVEDALQAAQKVLRD